MRRTLVFLLIIGGFAACWDGPPTEFVEHRDGIVLRSFSSLPASSYLAERRRILQYAPFTAIRDVVSSGGLLAVLGADGTISWVQPGTGIISQVEIKGETGLVPGGLVSLHDELGIWDKKNGLLNILSSTGDVVAVDTVVANAADLRPGFFRPRTPPRNHGAMETVRDHRIVEIRPFEQQILGPTTDGFLVSYVDGRPTDTLMTFRVPSYSVPGIGGRECCIRPRLFSPQPQWDVVPERGVAFALGSKPEVVLIDASGDTLWVTQWKVRAASVSNRQRKAYLFAEAAGLRDYVPKFEQDAIRRDVDNAFSLDEKFFDDQVPVITQLLVDQQSRIWIRRFDPDVWPDGLSPLWDVLNPDGSFRGTVYVPRAVHVYLITDHYVVGSHPITGRLDELVLLPTSGLRFEDGTQVDADP